MREYKILVIDEDEMFDGGLKRGSQKPLQLADYVVVCNNDGTCKTIKDRWDYPSNLRKVEIHLPQEVKGSFLCFSR